MWVGAGLLVGALTLAFFTVVVNWGRHEDGLLDETGGWWLLSVLVAVLVLAYGVQWGRVDPRLPVREPEGRAYVFWLAVFSAGGVYLAFVGFPTDAFSATVDDARRYDPSPAAAGMWLVVCSVALGCLFMLPSVHAPRLRPLRGSLPSVTAGASAVVLVGVLMVTTAFPRQPGSTAGELGDPAPVPSVVGGMGWSWAPPMGTEIEEVRAGTHGPLALLDDGVVSLDGTTGEELWSFRRPRDWGRSVWADDEHAYVRYAHGTVPEETEPDAPGEPIERTTVVLDIGTGEITGEHTVLEPDEWGVLVGVTPEARIERSWADDDGTLVLTGRSLDDGEELWSRTLVEAGGYVEMHEADLDQWIVPPRGVDALVHDSQDNTWWIAGTWVKRNMSDAEKLLARLVEAQPGTARVFEEGEDPSAFRAYLYATHSGELSTLGGPMGFGVGHADPAGAFVFRPFGPDAITSGATTAETTARAWVDAWRSAGRPGWGRVRPVLLRESVGWRVRAELLHAAEEEPARF